MDTSIPGTIVVGVTGPGQEVAAMRFAAEAARREGADVLLVHAFAAALPPPPPSILLTYAEAGDAAAWVVKGVAEEFEDLTGGSVPFRTSAVAGVPWHALVDVSAGARMIVVQHRAAHWLGRMFVGSTVNGAAGHSDCPVVSVPPGWQPEEASGDVVVGVHEGGEPRQALDAGFGWAAATGASVRVVHAWRLDAVYDDIISDRVSANWHAGQLRALESAVGELRHAHPTVEVELEVRHQWPEQVLVDHSRSASLVVVGRHARRGRLSPHLGSVARTVLREATSPVMVVPLEPPV